MRLQLVAKVSDWIVTAQRIQYGWNEHMRARTQRLHARRGEARRRVDENNIKVVQHLIAYEQMRETVPDVILLVAHQPSDHLSVFGACDVIKGGDATDAIDPANRLTELPPRQRRAANEFAGVRQLIIARSPVRIGKKHR